MTAARGRSGGTRRARSFSHHALYETEDARAKRCDVCDAPIRATDDDLHPAGAGIYVWTRGDEVRREEPPLCPTCGATLGMAQVRRWEIEDDEEG